MIRCVAIDDERLVLDLLVDNIRKVPFLTLVKAFKNPREATELLQSEKVDLIFLDIQMPQLNGLQFLKSLKSPPMVILVTAYQQYALEGYDFNVVDYLLKPVSFERFLKACNKAQKLYDVQERLDGIDKSSEHIFVHVEYKLVRVIFSEIMYIEGLKDYIKIYLSTRTKPVITKMSMKAIEAKLPAYQFTQIHKSFIVSVNKISSIKRDFICIADKEIPIGDSFKDNISKILDK